MLRITPCGSAERAKDYFREALSRGEYYTEAKSLGQEIVGRWGGEAAAKLGLAGEVSKDAFDALCDNLSPVTGERLTVRTRSDRRVGYDLNFHVPKSVSLMLEVAGDDRILGAFREAVAETMAELERSAQTRVRKGGVSESRVTGNLVWGEFVHFTARPVEGVPDPHLHCHAVCFNATWDPVESRWKAADLGEIKQDAPYHQAAYHARLAGKLIELGYTIERRGEGWEIAGVPPDLIGAFSRRTEEIERLAAERGLHDAASKAALGARTRAKKLDVASMEELRSIWRERLSDAERAAIAATQRRAERSRGRVIQLDDRVLDACLEHAKGALFEQASVVPEQRLLAAALQHGVGTALPEAMRERLATHVAERATLRADVNGRAFVTTQDVLAEERAMLATVREGRGSRDPLKPEHAIADTQLSAEQRDAVRHVLESTDSVVVVRGRAGVGKTRTMRNVVEAIRESGKEVFVAAPTAMATHEVLRKEGFSNAQTVAHLLRNPELRSKVKGQVLWVDEAGLLSVPDLQRLVALADRSNARLILTGDTRQHRSVIRGDALRLLETYAGVRSAELTTVRRQDRGAYREAAEALARGDLATGVARLETLGAIRETTSERVAGVVAEEYRRCVNAGLSTLVVSPTHAEGRSVTGAIRASLREAGRLGLDDEPVTQLRSRHLSEADRRDPARCRVGDVAVFHQAAKGGFRRGDQAEVTGVDKQTVTVRRRRDNATVALPLHAASRYELFEEGTLGLAAGDRVRITRNGRTQDGKHRLSNGAIYSVKAVTPDGAVTLTNGWKLPTKFGHLAHGYCVTSDASQGRTVDAVILAQSGLSEAAGSRQQFYTSVTRGRKRCTIVTDDKEQLLSAIRRDASRMSAIELMREAVLPPRHRGSPSREHLGRWMALKADEAKRRPLDRGEKRRQKRRDRGVDRGIERGEPDRER